MNIATKLRKKGIEINSTGKKAFLEQPNHRIFDKKQLSSPTSKRTSNALCTKKHTRGRLK
jgi:hypothetical protein